MKVLVFGAAGQLGQHLCHVLLPLGEVVALTHAEVELADSNAIAAVIARDRPQLIVNAAAYTAVDQAESEPALAEQINHHAPLAMARAAQRCDALLIHYSTDYVFDGAKRSAYDETDAPNPLGAYGASKWRGEQAVLESGAAALILRTTWVYAAHGKNFLRTILRLAAEREELRIIDDQYGAPTCAEHLALATVNIAQQALARRQAKQFSSGIYHVTAQGETTWYRFADAIISGWRQRAGADALQVKQIVPITTADYPTAAQRPKNSRLSNRKLQQDFGVALPDWRNGLQECLDRLASQAAH